MPQQRSAYAVGEPPVPFRHVGESAMGVAMLFALPVRLALRRNIGLGLLRKSYLAGMTLFLLAASWWGNLHLSLSLFGGLGVQNGNDTSLRNFALFVFLPLGVWQRVQRLREEKRGVEPHNYWHGDGWWGGFLPLPQKYIDTFVDPLVAFLAGALLRYRLGCGLLGLWLMIGAVVLLVVEKTLFTQAIEHYRTKRDLVKEATWDAQMLSQTGKQSDAGTSAPDGGIATGIDEELAAQIERNARTEGRI